MESFHVDTSRIQSIDLRSRVSGLRKSPIRRPNQLEMAVIDLASLIVEAGRTYVRRAL